MSDGEINLGSEESDSSFELMKRKHLRLLKEEQELLKQVSRSTKVQGHTGKSQIGRHEGEKYVCDRNEEREADYEKYALRDKKYKHGEARKCGEVIEREAGLQMRSRSSKSEGQKGKENRKHETDCYRYDCRGTRVNLGDSRRNVERFEKETTGISRSKSDKFEDRTNEDARRKKMEHKVFSSQKEKKVYRANKKGDLDIILSDESFTDVTDLNPSKLSSSYLRQGERSEMSGHGQKEEGRDSSENSVNFLKENRRQVRSKYTPPPPSNIYHKVM